MSTRGFLDACDIRIAFKIAFKNSTNLTGQSWKNEIKRAKDAIESVWNGDRRHGACPVSYKVRTHDNGQSDIPPSEHHLAEIFPYGQLPSDAAYEAFANQQTEGAYAYWQDGHSDLVIAHEAGHLMALADEYGLTLDGGSTVPEEFDEDPPSLMASVDPGAEPKQRHIDSVMETLVIKCPVVCGMWGLKWTRRRVRPPDYAKMEAAARRIRFLAPQLPPLPDVAAILVFLHGNPAPQLAHMAALRLVRFASADPAALVTALATETSVLGRWALVLALSQVHLAEIADRLLAIAQDRRQDERVRVEAARGLVMQGRREGVDVLLEGLGFRTRALTHPPRTLRFYCSETLRGLVSGHDFGFDAARDEAGREQARRAWEDWWRANGATVQVPRQ